jgi:hypothetical protein
VGVQHKRSPTFERLWLRGDRMVGLLEAFRRFEGVDYEPAITALMNADDDCPLFHHVPSHMGRLSRATLRLLKLPTVCALLIVMRGSDRWGAAVTKRKLVVPPDQTVTYYRLGQR